MNPAAIEDIYELTPMQQGMLFHTVSAPSSGVYVQQLLCRLAGKLDQEKFERAWQTIVATYPVLRTSFHWEEIEKPLQVVNREAAAECRWEDWRDVPPAEIQERLDAFLAEDRAQGFDLATPPLMRMVILRLSEDDQFFLWSHHHLLLDGWAHQIVMRAFSSSYFALCSGREPALDSGRPYSEYVAWLQQQDTAEAEAFWRKTLAGFTAPTPLHWGTTATRRSPTAPRLEQREARLSIETSAALEALARRLHLSLNTVMQGAWALILSRYSGERDVVFGSVVSGRPAELPGVESMVGMFINTLPVRVKIRSQESLSSWLTRLQAQQAEARRFEYCPLVEIHRWSDVPRGAPLFDSLLLFENFPIQTASEAESSAQSPLEILDYNYREQPNFPLVLETEPSRPLLLRVHYDRDSLEPTAIRRMLAHLRTLLEAMVADPETRLADLPHLAAPLRHAQSIEWNDRAHEARPRPGIHQLFERQVKQTPEAVALKFADDELSYLELNERANRLAHHLRGLGIGAEDPIGIFLDRSTDLVVTVLASLKTGGTYIPLDPEYPASRLAFMMRDAGIEVLITRQELADQVPEHPARVLLVDDPSQQIVLNSAADPDSPVHGENLAYLIYTSGSTGRPKGVQVGHRNVVNFLDTMAQRPGLGPGDAILAVTTLSFDIAVLELLLPLAVGARIELASRQEAMDGQLLQEKLESSGATVMQATPTTWRLLLESGWPGDPRLKALCGGEALPRELADRLLDKVGSLWNMYGPTETTVWSTILKVSPHRLTIGRPIHNTRIVIADSDLSPQPIGAPGELLIGGDGVVRGYRGRPRLTAERFIPEPGGDGTRLYRTGDLARWMPHGDLEFLGRIDYQVKVRGFRIEPEEIETRLLQHDAVRQAVVAARSDSAGTTGLVAYIVWANPSEEMPAAGELRGFLQAKLPPYMVPGRFIGLDALPLLPNGKVNRGQLPEPGSASAGGDAYVAPRTPVEQQLAALWCEVLELERVGVDDNFFELGGHSILAMRALSRINQQLEAQLSLEDVFDHPTLAALAARVTEQQAEEISPEEMEALLEELEELPEEDLDSLLHDEMQSLN